MSLRALSVLVVSLLLGSLQQAVAEMPLNMTQGVTALSQEIYDLHMLIFWICVAIGIVVFGIMFYAIIKHRKSKGAVAAQFHDNTTVEIIWTLIPLLILVAMAIPATATLLKMEDTRDADLDILITGYQWKWHYKYLQEDIGFFSNLSTPMEEIKNQQEKNPNYLLEVDNPIVVPTGQKIRFLLTANDVLHAWWVPDLGVKKDAIPGFINETWAQIDKPGIYRGQCAELCGANHGFMPIVVDARSPEDFQLWLAETRQAQTEAESGQDREWSFDELMAEGEQVYNRSCAVCHQASGQGLPGVFPALTAGSMATGPIEAHIDVVVNGSRGTAMQAFANQLNDAELAAVITYERNAWGNDTGDLVQPSQIKARR